MLDPGAQLLDLAERDLVEIDPDLHQRHGEQARREIKAQPLRQLDLALQGLRKLGCVFILLINHRIARHENGRRYDLRSSFRS